MIERLWEAQIPFSWVVADTVYSGNLDLRTWLEAHGYSYVLAVACDEPVGILTPEGRQRLTVAEAEALLVPAEAWQRLSTSDGTKGPRLFDWALLPILHQWEDDGRHFLLIRRCLDEKVAKAYYFVFAPPGTTLAEMVQAIGQRWCIEECAREWQSDRAGCLRSAWLHLLVPVHYVGDARFSLLGWHLCGGSHIPG
jgi:SRSO17 transposase